MCRSKPDSQDSWQTGKPRRAAHLQGCHPATHHSLQGSTYAESPGTATLSFCILSTRTSVLGPPELCT